MVQVQNIRCCAKSDAAVCSKAETGDVNHTHTHTHTPHHTFAHTHSHTSPPLVHTSPPRPRAEARTHAPTQNTHARTHFSWSALRRSWKVSMRRSCLLSPWMRIASSTFRMLLHRCVFAVGQRKISASRPKSQSQVEFNLTHQRPDMETGWDAALAHQNENDGEKRMCEKKLRSFPAKSCFFLLSYQVSFSRLHSSEVW